MPLRLFLFQQSLCRLHHLLQESIPFSYGQAVLIQNPVGEGIFQPQPSCRIRITKNVLRPDSLRRC